jgi:drug/metabolite transporter (DMT)-like permease
MEPITAAVVSFLVLHVVLTPFQYLGGLLIIGSVAIIVLRARLPI